MGNELRADGPVPVQPKLTVRESGRANAAL
jgi:hypothetical protein